MRTSDGDVDVRVVKALAHPTRVRILALLGARELVSPVELSAELDVPLGTVGYHVRRLEQLGFLELAKRTKRRGATEHHYRAREALDLPTASADEAAASGREGAGAVQAVEEAQRALADGGFEVTEALATSRFVTLDRDGRASLGAAVEDWQRTLARIARDSDRRQDQAPARAHACTAVVLVFDAVAA
jgi:DNA-binding transcriptional ArsR family regulator